MKAAKIRLTITFPIFTTFKLCWSKFRFKFHRTQILRSPFVPSSLEQKFSSRNSLVQFWYFTFIILVQCKVMLLATRGGFWLKLKEGLPAERRPGWNKWDPGRWNSKVFGLNFAETILFFYKTMFLQCLSRTFRLKQTKPVESYYFKERLSC